MWLRYSSTDSNEVFTGRAISVPSLKVELLEVFCIFCLELVEHQVKLSHFKGPGKSLGRQSLSGPAEKLGSRVSLLRTISFQQKKGYKGKLAETELGQIFQTVLIQ